MNFSLERGLLPSLLSVQIWGVASGRPIPVLCAMLNLLAALHQQLTMEE